MPACHHKLKLDHPAGVDIETNKSDTNKPREVNETKRKLMKPQIKRNLKPVAVTYLVDKVVMFQGTNDAMSITTEVFGQLKHINN